MNKVMNEVQTYDNENKQVLKVHSHSNECSKVVIEVNGVKKTVIATELKTAIDNATNTG